MSLTKLQSQSVDTNITVAGVVTATAFYGDGSNLTGLPQSGIGIGTTGGVVGYGVTFIDLKGAGVSTTFYDSNVGIVTIFFEGGGGSSGAIGIGTQFPASPSNGDLFYHIDYARTFVYYNEVTLGIGSTAVWVDSAPFNEGGGLVAAKNETAFTATAGQTTFTTPYTVGFIDVYLNGVRLSPTEFTATSGTSVVLTEAASLGDIIDIVEYTMGRGVAGDDRWSYTIVGIHTLSNVGIGTTNPTSKLTVTGDVKVTGIVTASSFSGSGANLTNLNIPTGFNELDAALFS